MKAPAVLVILIVCAAAGEVVCLSTGVDTAAVAAGVVVAVLTVGLLAWVAVRVRRLP